MTIRNLWNKFLGNEKEEEPEYPPAPDLLAEDYPPIAEPPHTASPFHPEPEPSGEEPAMEPSYAYEEPAATPFTHPEPEVIPEPEAPQPVARQPIDFSQPLTASPEELCGIDPAAMNRDEIRAQLALLYRRHNHAAGSLNKELRDEAEMMLDAIVICRERYVTAELK